MRLHVHRISFNNQPNEWNKTWRSEMFHTATVWGFKYHGHGDTASQLCVYNKAFVLKFAWFFLLLLLFYFRFSLGFAFHLAFRLFSDARRSFAAIFHPFCVCITFSIFVVISTSQAKTSTQFLPQTSDINMRVQLNVLYSYWLFEHTCAPYVLAF